MKKKTILISATIVFILLMLIVGGYLLYLINDLGNSINKDGKSDSLNIIDLLKNPPDKTTTILALGVDARAGDDIEGSRTDTIMVATFNTKTKQIAEVSFPRDSYVNIEGYGYTKLNHASAYGGVPLLAETIENNFGIKIDNYVLIDFVAFEKIVDALNGIEVDVAKKMYIYENYKGTTLYPGVQTLNGEDLLAYVRFRNDSDGDLGRIIRQQEAIEKLGVKATSLSAFLKAPEMFNILGEHIKTDLTINELLDLAKKYSNFKKDDWHSMTLGGEPARSQTDNLWYYFFTEEDKNEVKSFLESYGNVAPTK